LRQSSRGEGLIKYEDGTTYGISLGADFVAEHEFGIKDIQYYFGIKNDKGFGIQNRQVTVFDPQRLHLFEYTYWEVDYETLQKSKHTDLVLIFDTYFDWSILSDKERAERIKKLNEFPRIYSSSKDYERSKMAASWSNNSFAILARDEEYKSFLHELFNAFKNKDVAFGVKTSVFNTAPLTGLNMVIVSKVSKEDKQELIQSDKLYAKLLKEVKDSGIENYLAQNVPKYYGGKPYFALSPKYDQDGKIKFWLNPSDQKKYNYGWFTLEELRQWGRGEGPVIKKDKQKL